MANRDRQRLFRQRQHNNVRCLRISITNATATVAAFVRLGLLMEAEKDDDRAIEAAIAHLCRAGFCAIQAAQDENSKSNLAGDA
jgi:hypothetical protein